MFLKRYKDCQEKCFKTPMVSTFYNIKPLVFTQVFRGKRRPAAGALFTHWSELQGKHWSSSARPERFLFVLGE